MTDSAYPLVTVVTPSFNQGNYIRETIESVLSQDYPNIEHWVVDGGSTDSTLSILREYEGDPRFHWMSERDRGQADAVNKGWRLARGEILGWLNSDDTYLPGAISFQVAQIMRDPAIGLAYGNAPYITATGEPAGCYHARPFDRERFLHLSAIPQPTVFMRRSLFERFGGMDTELHYALDYELYVRYSWETTFAYTGREIATYRLHAESKTIDRFDDVLAETVEVVRKVCDAHAAELPGVKALALSDWYWSGALRNLEVKNFRQAMKHARSALGEHPLRPRMATFAVAFVDALLGTRLAERVSTLLDRRANRAYERARSGGQASA